MVNAKSVASGKDYEWQFIRNQGPNFPQIPVEIPYKPSVWSIPGGENRHRRFEHFGMVNREPPKANARSLEDVPSVVEDQRTVVIVISEELILNACVVAHALSAGRMLSCSSTNISEVTAWERCGRLVSGSSFSPRRYALT